MKHDFWYEIINSKTVNTKIVIFYFGWIRSGNLVTLQETQRSQISYQGSRSFVGQNV